MSFTLSEILDNLYTTTWQNMKSEVVDQIFDATPFYFWLKDGGRLEKVEGGRFLTEPVQFDKNDNVRWTGKGGQSQLNDYEFMTIAKEDWRYIEAPIVRFWVDDQQNRGRNAIFSLMNAKMANTQESLVTEFETRLAGGSGASTGSGTLEHHAGIDGLQVLVANDPTASVSVHGINQSTYSWWRNQTIDMTGLSFATYGVAKMRTMLNNCMNNRRMDAPDIILADQTSYEYYEDAVLDTLRTTNTKLGDMGFQNIVFKGIPMIWSPSITQKMYFLNTRFIKLKYDPMVWMDMTEWKAIPNQGNDRVAQILSACSFMVSRRRCQGVIHTINTA